MKMWIFLYGLLSDPDLQIQDFSNFHRDIARNSVCFGISPFTLPKYIVIGYQTPT